jgi:hypothetical protein
VNRCGRAGRMTSTPLHQPGLPLLCAVRHIPPADNRSGASGPTTPKLRRHRLPGQPATVTEVPLWTASTGSSAVSGGPVVSGGQLYVGTADGQVIAYGLP